MGAMSGIGIRETSFKMEERLDNLVPSRIMYWTELIEKRKKKIPNPKDMRADNSILKH